MTTDLSKVVTYYESGVENDRLASGIGRLELARTESLLRRLLPPAPSRVLDVGGGPAGRYAAMLAHQGYEVVLVDPVPLHVEGSASSSRRDRRSLLAPIRHRHPRGRPRGMGVASSHRQRHRGRALDDRREQSPARLRRKGSGVTHSDPRDRPRGRLGRAPRREAGRLVRRPAHLRRASPRVGAVRLRHAESEGRAPVAGVDGSRTVRARGRARWRGASGLLARGASRGRSVHGRAGATGIGRRNGAVA